MQCLYSVSREELFAATFYLFCDKQRDMNTIVFMKRILFLWHNLASREQRGREKNTSAYPLNLHRENRLEETLALLSGSRSVHPGTG